jgi:hypothetical protein
MEDGIWPGMGIVHHDKGMTYAHGVWTRGPISEGTPAETLSLSHRPKGLAGVPFSVMPSLELLRPAADALSNDARPAFVLKPDALCAAAACGFGADYLSGYRVEATLDGVSIGDRFVFDPASVRATFQPEQRLAEGTHLFAARVQDPFGHRSGPVESRLIVDTLPPRLLALAPADGSSHSSSPVTLTGMVDDPLATVVVEGPGVAYSTLAGAGLEFRLPVPLRPGVNIFRVTAMDPSGNSFQTELRLSYGSVSLGLVNPGDGVTVDGDSVIVTGLLEGPSNTGVTVNGVAAAVSGGRFHAEVPLAMGPNTLTAVATTPAGERVTRSLNVTGTGRPGAPVTANVTEGNAPLRVGFAFTDGVVPEISAIEADF